MPIPFLVVGIILLWNLPADSAIIGLPCAPTSISEKMLNEKYSEAPFGMGTSENEEGLFKLWRSADGSNWTFTATMWVEELDMKVSCVLAEGINWTDVIWHLPAPGQEL